MVRERRLSTGMSSRERGAPVFRVTQRPAKSHGMMRSGFIGLLVLGLLVVNDGSFLPAARSRGRWTVQPSRLSQAAAANGDSSSDVPECLILTVFPLRKSVRLPTETLTLNLFEERFLALAESVLASDQRLFGALFSSDKPQVVPKGTEAIVPMIQTGDVGVVFVLEDSEEGLVPTQGSDPRRRIRLVGTGVRRFRIQKVLHNGYGDDSLPFMVVDALPFNDESCLLGTESLGLERQLRDKAMSTKEHLKGAGEDGGRTEFLRGEPSDRIESLIAKSYGVDLTASKLSEVRSELRSFALASVLLSDASSKKRLEVLRLQSTDDRLDCLSSSLRSIWSFWR